jgi:hypothetical protein
MMKMKQLPEMTKPLLMQVEQTMMLKEYHQNRQIEDHTERWTLNSCSQREKVRSMRM